MSKTLRGLGRSLVRRLYCRPSIGLAAFAFCVLLPLFSLADFSVRLKYFPSIGSTNVTYQSFGDILDEEALHDVYMSHRFGILLKGNSISSPNDTTSTSWYYAILNNQINPLGTGNTYTNSPANYPRVFSLYNVAVSLMVNGYTGPGLDFCAAVGTRTCYNVYFPDIIANVFSSTNSVYRSIVLSHLSSIQSSVQNIELNVSGLQSSVDRGNDILSSISNISQSALFPLSSIASNSSFNASLQGFVNAAIVDFHSFLDDLVENGEASQSDADYWGQTYDGYSNPTSRAVFASLVARNVNDRAMANSFLSVLNSSANLLSDPGSYFNSSVVDALIGDYPEEESKRGSKASNSVRTSIKSQLQAWRNEAKQQLQDWKSDLKSDLQAWKTSDETGYLNIRQTIDDNFNRNFTIPDRFSTNRLPFTAYVTNYVTRIVTNSIEQSSADIQSNATSNVDRQIKGDEDRWDEFKRITTGNGEGLNVRVKFPLWESDGYHVNVRDDGVIQAIQDGITIVNPDLTDIRDSWDSFMEMYSPTNSLDWEPWFQKWVPFSEVVTNYYAEFNASVPASEIASDFLDRGFDSERYSSLPWFERVEVLLAMIADVRSNSVEVADIQEDMDRQVENFQGLSTNVVAVSSDVVGLFGYVQRFSSSLQSIFGDRAAPLTGDYVLLSAGHWIGDQPLVLRINPTIQNLCRLIMQCIWYLGFLVLLWVVVNWCWQKVVAVLRWLWSMFDV